MQRHILVAVAVQAPIYESMYRPFKFRAMANGHAPDHPDNTPRWLAGAYGGLAISIAQIIGQNSGPKLADFLTHYEWRNSVNLLLTTILGIAVLMALGSLVARFEDEQSRRKLFLMGIAAPALFAAAAPSVFQFIERKAAELAPVSAAHAAVMNSTCDVRNNFTILDGLKLFFGASDEPRYRVIVGSFKTEESAQALAKKINAEDPSFKAFAGRKAPCNEYYAVVVSQYLPLNEAKRIQARALKLNSVEDAYLSPYENR